MTVSRGQPRRAGVPAGRVRRLVAAVGAALGALLAATHPQPASGSSGGVTAAGYTAQAAALGTDMGYLRTNLHAAGWDIGRDSGYSATFATPAGERAFWIMGDTFIEPGPDWPTGDPHATGDMVPWWRNNTAAVGPFAVGAAPTGLTEVGGLDVPHQVIDDPAAGGSDTVARNGVVPCPAGLPLYPWAQGVARIPGSNQLLIAYSTLCQGADSTRVVSFGLAQYDPVALRVVADTPDVFQGDPLDGRFVLQAPVFTSTHVLFSKTCALPACPQPRTYLARVALGASPATARPWLDPAAYRWWDGTSGWVGSAGAGTIQPDPTWSSNMGHQPSLPGPDSYVLVEQPDTTGATVRVSTAPAPQGPWTVRAEGASGCDLEGGFEARVCRGFIHHPELGDADSIVVSFAQAKNDPPLFEKATDNQVRLISIPV